MEDKGLSRRFLLGAVGAAALAKIAMPFRPKAEDIVVATTIPPLPVQAMRSQQQPIPDAEVEIERCLYDKNGNPVCMVTHISITQDAIDIGPGYGGFIRKAPGQIRGEITAYILPETLVREGDYSFRFGSGKLTTA